MGGVCGFDPDVSFQDEFENAKRAIHNLGSSALGAVRNLLVASVLSEVRDLNPELYDTLSRGIAEAKESVSIAMKSCEDFTADVSSGRSPADEWIKISTRGDWGRGAAAGRNPTEVREQVLAEVAPGRVRAVSSGSVRELGSPEVREPFGVFFSMNTAIST